MPKTKNEPRLKISSADRGAEQIQDDRASEQIAEVLESVRTGYDTKITAPQPKNDLFGPVDCPLGDGAIYLPRMAAGIADALVDLVKIAAKVAPFRYFETPMGKPMKIACTNLGPLGWVASRKGYGYSERDPQTGQPWMAMPEWLINFAIHCARQGGFFNFEPNACLINGYRPGVDLGMHQDKDERDLTRPIVSISLGLTGVFKLGGLKRTDRVEMLPVEHTDVIVFGGKSRLRFHGVAPVAEGSHAVTGRRRINLTIREA